VSDLTFPRHVYWRGGVFLIVQTVSDYEAALQAGGLDAPSPDWPAPDAYQLILEPPAPDEPKKRGRPRKAETT
jgi:hypothetical protein